MSSMSPAVEKSNYRGVVYMMIGAAFLSLMDAVAKVIVEANYPVLQMLAVRGWIVLTLMILWMLYEGSFAQLKTRRPLAHFARAVLGLLAPLFFFVSLKDLPLADATILFFVSPFLMTALSVPLFKEKVGLHRWVAIIAGFIGIVIVVRPGSASFQMAALLPLAASVCYVGIMLLGRFLGSTESNLTIIFYVTLGSTIVSSVAQPWVWEPVSLPDLGVMFVMALLYLGGSYFLLRAFIVAEIGAVAPFEYSGIIWAILLGYVFWGDVPDEIVFLGASIVVASGVYMIYRERRLTREHQTRLDKML